MASVLFTSMRGNTNKKVREALAYRVIMERLRRKSLWLFLNEERAVALVRRLTTK